jgi:hypothetical protein
MNIKKKIMCLNAVDQQLDVKNIQEFLKQSRYWGADSQSVLQDFLPVI